MPIFQYGAVPLEPCQTISFSHRSVYTPDNVTFLYNHCRLHVRGKYNPKSTAVSFSGYVDGVASTPSIVPTEQPPIDTTGTGTTLPAQTETALRQYLKQPRRTLAYTSNANSIIKVTAPDAGNGPLPGDLTITQITSDHTFTVDFVIEFFVYEAHITDANNQVLLNPVLAHRWRVAQNLDLDFYTTKLVQGYAILNQNALSTLSLTAENFRTYLSHPIPPNYRREGLQVHVSEDGLQVAYSFVDREQPINTNALLYANFGVTRIQSSVAATVGFLGLEERLAALMQGGSSVLSQPSGWSALNPGAWLRWVGSSIGGAVNIMASGMPQIAIIFSARVWGNSQAARQKLALVATTVNQSRVNNIAAQFPGITKPVTLGPFSAGGPQLSRTIQQDVAGKYVEATATYLYPRLNQLLSVDGGEAGPLALSFPRTATGQDPAQDDIVTDPTFKVIAGKALLATDPDVINPAPPNSNGFRGLQVNMMITQALEQPAQTPFKVPPDPTYQGVATDRTPPVLAP